MATLVGRLPFSQACFPPSPPTTDHATFIGLSDNEIRAMCMSRAEEYHMFALALLSIYNSIAPIHHLPPEILSKIFEGCWMDRKSLRIGHVCRRWRSALLSTTAFWVNAVNGETFSPDELTITYLGVILERSATRMVELSFTCFSKSISRCLSPYAGRVTSLELSLSNESGLFALLASLDSGMPWLETLTIAFDRYGDPEEPSWTNNPRIESRSPPVLPRLTRLTAPPFLFSILAVPSLRHITLRAWHQHHSYDGLLGSLAWFCKALAICSRNLLSLELFRTSLWVDIHLPHLVVSLPTLRHLEITDTARGCMSILSYLSLPKAVQIQCTNLNDGSLSAIISANPDPFHSPICATDRVEIRGTATTISLHCYAGDGERLCLGLVGSTRRLRPDDIVELFRDSPRGVRELAVSRLTRREVQGVEFRAFPHIIRLAIHGETAKHVLRRLARSIDDNGVHLPLEDLCPALETLTVDFYPTPFKSRALRLGAALRNRDLAVVDADLRERCAELERVLLYRAQTWAHKLTRLEFGCTDESGKAHLSGHHQECLPDPADPDWVSWWPIVEPLEKLVDGPVVFTGYRFFVASE